jgi:FK506-binding nuclear protein
MVTGTHAVHLTGNYVLPEDDGRASLYDDDSDSEDEYDLAPEEDELAALDNLLGDQDSESDDLDDLPNPRITELPEDLKPKATKKDTLKLNGTKSNKRAAEDSDQDLDEMIATEAKKATPASSVTVSETTVTEAPKKLTKSEKKKLKKLKNNEGNAVAVDPPATDGAVDAKSADKTTNSEKKVQFAKKLEQGPSGSQSQAPSKSQDRIVQGVTISDRKLGSGPAASSKSKSRIELRYIGKLTSNNSVFDSNKKGPPFVVKVGAGDVIPGFDIGLDGIQAGGERRITIPAKLGYGSKAMPGIPKGSELCFDVKCLSVS